MIAVTRELRSWWWLGAVLLFAACVALKLNGSSIGRWQQVLREPEPIRGSPAYAEIDKAHAAEPAAKWIAYGDYVTGQFIKTTGASVLNGTKIVPDLEFWRSLDPAGTYASIYNRYAWIICVPKVFPEEVSFTLLQMEFFTVDLPPGLKELRAAGYDYYVFAEQWRDASFYDFSVAARTPNAKLWIYRRDPD